MKRNFWIAGLTSLAIVFICVGALFYTAYNQIPFSINGKSFNASENTNIGAALRQSGYNLNHGSLLSLDGKVLYKNGGKLPRIYMNGRRATESAALIIRAKIVFTPGKDIKEKIKKRIVSIPARTQTIGSGVFIALQRRGIDGRREEYYGEKSGLVVSGRILSYPEPTIINRSDAGFQKMVALTFDDGPNPPFTQQILGILTGRQVPATFFVVGQQIKKFPDLVGQESAGGFAVENHTLTHSRLDRMPAPAVDNELDQTRLLIEQATKTEPTWFRPPYGATNTIVAEALVQRGYKLAMWNVDTLDWKAHNPEEIWQRFIAQIHPGSVVLMHDGGGNRSNTVAILPRVIQYLLDQGYAIVTLDQLYGGR